MSRTFGCQKLCLVAHFDHDPGTAPRDVSKALDSLGLSFSAINTKGQKQTAFSTAALETAITRHATAKFGATTELLERPKLAVNGPGAFLRLDSSVRDDRVAAAENRFPPVLQIFWPLDATLPTRKTLDQFIKRLATAATVRVAAAGVVWAGIERPMMKSAKAVADEMLANLLARPHAHSNHRAKLDTTAATLEPGFWNYLGPRHLERLGKRDVDARRTTLGDGASFTLFDEAPLETTKEVFAAHAAYARSMGPLWPPVLVSEIMCGLSIPKTAGFGLKRWLARYDDDSIVPTSLRRAR